MSAVLTNIGEEWYAKHAGEGASVSVGLYNDSTDAASDTTDLGDLTTEPTGSAYARQSDTLTASNQNTNWGPVTSSKLTFDTSDSSQSVDAYFLTATFTSTEAGDGGNTEHIIATGLLSQSRNLSDVDQFEIEAGTAGFMVD